MTVKRDWTPDARGATRTAAARRNYENLLSHARRDRNIRLLNNAQLDLTGKKYCPGCDRRRPKTEFHLAMAQPDGLRQYCKICNSEMWNKEKAA